MAGMPTAMLCNAGALCIVLSRCAACGGRDPPRFGGRSCVVLPLWKVIRWRPHAGELEAGPARARFFSLAATDNSELPCATGSARDSLSVPARIAIDMHRGARARSLSCLAGPCNPGRRALWPFSIVVGRRRGRHDQSTGLRQSKLIGRRTRILRQPPWSAALSDRGTTRERHWEIFRRLCVDTDTRGRRVTDAWYAALAIEWGCEWVTLDRDYARFPGLRWRAPDAP
jgi:hypothetical protein